MVSPKLSESEAKTKLTRIHEKLWRAVDSADLTMREVCQSNPKLAKAIRGRGRASLMYELITDNARSLLFGEPGIVLSDKYFLQVNVDREIDLRFKKANKRWETRNYPTEHHLLYSNQLPLFPGMLAGSVRLTVCYQTNPVGQTTNVGVSYPMGNESVWAYEISRPEEGTGDAPATIPMNPKKPDVFTSKKVAEEAAKKAEESA